MPRGISLLVPFREGGESAVVAHSEKIALHYEMPQSDSEKGLETKPMVRWLRRGWSSRRIRL